jgi:hypothetical protein
MRGLTLVLSATVLVLAAVNSSIPLLAGWESHSLTGPSLSGGMAGTGWETLPISQTAEREGLTIHVVSVQRPVDSQDRRLVVSLVVENHTSEEWFLVPRAFALQDGAHVTTYPAQFLDVQLPVQYLQEEMLASGETRQGALLFRAPSSDGLDLTFGLFSGGSASYLPLFP